MRKIVLLIAIVLMSARGFSQSADVPAPSINHGGVVSEVAKATEPGKGKGKIVSETAKSDAGKKIKKVKKEHGEIDNHGKAISAVAHDKSLRGKEKGRAMKAAASGRGQIMRNARAAQQRGSARRPMAGQRHIPKGRPGN